MITLKYKINKLQFVRTIYWVFLTYMIAAFIWWSISLENQNKEIALVKVQSIKRDDPSFFQKVQDIQAFQNRKTKQYIGEGLTFMFLFLLGAIYVYRYLIKQLRYSNQQQNFMMAVTHELKTPIAIAQLNMETLSKRELDLTQQKKLIENTLEETHRLDALCNNILLASQLDIGRYESEMQLVDISTIISSGVQSFQQRYPLRKCNTDIASDLYIQGETLLIQLLINNLLDNAHKYSSLGEPISIELQQNVKAIVLQVRDQGEGILINEREKIFEKFYRIGDESTRTTKGTGLGLFLCKRIAQFHQAFIQVVPNNPYGSNFTITFPLK